MIGRTYAKYGNRKTQLDGITFDSKMEAVRWAELKLLEKAGEISGLDRQVGFELLPSQKDENGRVTERSVTYVADFVYYDKNGKLTVEDAKGMRTDVYKIKRKLMLYFKGIKIKEV